MTGGDVNTGVPLQAAVADGPNNLNTIVPPAVAVTSDRVARSDNVAARQARGRRRLTVTIVGLDHQGVLVTAVEDTARLLASPL